MELSEEQQRFLDALEGEFSDRFTVHDEVYWNEHTAPAMDPPILEPWYNKPRRRFDFARRGRDNNVNGRDRSEDRSRYDRNDRHDRNDRYDRNDRHHRNDRYNRHSRDRDRSFSRESRDGRDRHEFNGGRGGHGGRDDGSDRRRDRNHHHRSEGGTDSGHASHQSYY